MKRSLTLACAATVTALATALPLASLPADAEILATDGVPRYAKGTVATEFTLSSFNVLGSTHTVRGRRAKMGSGEERIRLAARALDKHSVDVVGFQEFQIDQWAEFVRVAGDRYSVYPGGVNRKTVQNSIGWRTSDWELVNGYTVQIPYFKGELWQMPVVLLRNRSTGVTAYFANFHNPATNKRHRNNEPHRASAMARQVALAKSIVYETGLPTFFTGDMNEREVYFCGLTGQAPMKAANGGRFKNGTCTPPSPMPVDWIFGARGRAKMHNWVRDKSPLIKRITDHFMIRTDVKIKPTTTPVALSPVVPSYPLWATVGVPVPVVPTPTPTPPPPTTPAPSPTPTPSPTANPSPSASPTL